VCGPRPCGTALIVAYHAVPLEEIDEEELKKR
jgi:hypothetical protein